MDFFDENGNFKEELWEEYEIEKYAEKEREQLEDPEGYKIRMEQFEKGFANGYFFSAMKPADLSFSLSYEPFNPYSEGYGEGRRAWIKSEDYPFTPNEIENWMKVAKMLLSEKDDLSSQKALEELEALKKERNEYDYPAGLKRGSFIGKNLPEYIDIVLQRDKPGRHYNYAYGFIGGVQMHKQVEPEKQKSFLLGLADKYLPSWLRLNSAENNLTNVSKDKEIDKGIEPDL